MEGLEITIFSYKAIFLDNEEFRVDSEYYMKEYLNLNLRISDSPLLGNLVYMSDLSTNGSFKAVSDIIHDGNEKTVPFIRSGNTGNLFINKSELEFISAEAHKKLKKSTTTLNDIIMARKGKIGGASIITEEEVNFNCNENVIKLTLYEPEKINPWYFAVFFNSNYGLKQIERLATGNVQPWVSIFQIRKLKTYVTSISFQNVITNAAQNSHSFIIKSRNKYQQAETLLLETLGLSNFEPSAEPVNVKGFKESFLSTGRLDAEYYQKKYDNLEKAICSSNYKRIREIRTVNYRGMQPEYVENGSLDVINSKHILEDTLDYNGFEKTSDDYWGIQERARVFKGDILTYTTGANIGRTQVYRLDKKALASNHVNILRVKDENPFYIGFVLNSMVGRMQTEKYCAGSAQVELYPKDLDEFIIPIIDKTIQNQIIELTEESFHLKKQSERLLETAKRAVEIAIEQDEEAAIDYIQNTNS